MLLSSLSLSRVAHDNKDCEGNELSHEVRTIDAGELVWAVAFGSRHADTKPYSTNLNWYRYRIATDLLLATGLSSGRIRVYQVKTGEWQQLLSNCLLTLIVTNHFRLLKFDHLDDVDVFHLDRSAFVSDHL